MPLRFNKRISLGKFFKVNLGKTGASFSVGVPGAHFTTGATGNRVTVGIPGTGLSYTHKLDEKKKEKSKKTELLKIESAPQAQTPLEKEIVAGLNAQHNGDTATAAQHFAKVAADEAGAAIMLAYLEAGQGETKKAIALLEPILQSDQKLPTPLMTQYLHDQELAIAITPNVSAQVPLGSLAVALLLAELYQKEAELEKAARLLEEVDRRLDAPALTLSLCELYAVMEMWDDLIACAKQTENVDDVTLETLLWYGRAMQAKKLHQAAVEIFTEALRKKKNRSESLLREAQYWRAVSHDHLGSNAKAFGEFQKIYAAEPTYRDVALRVERS